MSENKMNSSSSYVLQEITKGNYAVISHFDLRNSDAENQILFQEIFKYLIENGYGRVKLRCEIEHLRRKSVLKLVFLKDIPLESLKIMCDKLEIPSFVFADENLEIYKYNKDKDIFELKNKLNLDSTRHEDLLKELCLFQFTEEIRQEIKIVSFDELINLSFNERAYGRKKDGDETRIQLL
jgi:hypothetical protein